MSLTKIHKILKKYRRLYQLHKDSWRDAQTRIRNGGNYANESYNHVVKGDKLLDHMMKELEGLEVFPKKKKKKSDK